MKSDNSLGYGVYYSLDDYAGLFRRVAVIVIDSFFLLMLGLLLWILLFAVAGNANRGFDLSGLFFLSWLFFAWLYLTALKRSRIRTVAYRILGLKIVTTRGEPPSLLTMTLRVSLWVFGPINLLLDLLWMGADTEQQSIRDCYLGTYVVRSDAEPIGEAPIHLTRYCGGGLALMYPRVVRPQRPPSKRT